MVLSPILQQYKQMVPYLKIALVKTYVETKIAIDDS